METESVLSILSDTSAKGKRSKNHRNHSHRVNRSGRSNKRDYEMAPFQTSVTLEDSRDGQEVIEVQILPQDENWGENTTAVTGNTSDVSGSVEDSVVWFGNEPDGGFVFLCHRYIGTVSNYILSIASFLSPVAMVVAPKIGFWPGVAANLSPSQKSILLACGAECKTLLVSLVFRLVLLVAGAWAVFFRSTATLPRICLFRACTLLFTLLALLAYWLFYIVHVTEGMRATAAGEDAVEYRALVNHAVNLANTLLFIYFIAVLLIEIRHLQPQFYIRVVRSPDGESRSYAVGQFSIQRAAVHILQRYYTEFPIFNPYLERLPVSKARRQTSTFKLYDVDGFNSGVTGSRTVLSSGRRRDSSHNERFYEEHEYERRVKKRRARLITATEEAFTHIKRMHHDPVGSITMDAHEAAQAVFPGLSRALQKYLRVTRQQPRFTMESILTHLANCLSHDLSPRAFLDMFLVSSPVLQNEKEQKPVQTWSLICSEFLSRPLKNGTLFQLRQNDISLLCHVYTIPHFSIMEEVVHPKSNQFVLRLNSETSV
ncbi:unnamed protein product [Bemisia tabaci]|uniref:Vang-like protein n=1 Tax=Bemisia tabaci TaxID=7038 RepID=A0A9P0F1Q4_BEMTA|nr:unnamed protein product [Bemisia tabaci]